MNVAIEIATAVGELHDRLADVERTVLELVGPFGDPKPPVGPLDDRGVGVVSHLSCDARRIREATLRLQDIANALREAGLGGGPPPLVEADRHGSGRHPAPFGVGRVLR